jgi:hypothetical protein
VSDRLLKLSVLVELLNEDREVRDPDETNPRVGDVVGADAELFESRALDNGSISCVWLEARCDRSCLEDTSPEDRLSPVDNSGGEAVELS